MIAFIAPDDSMAVFIPEDWVGVRNYHNPALDETILTVVHEK